MNSIKCTLNIDRGLKVEIDELVKSKKVKNLTEVVNDAVSYYLNMIKKQQYALEMEEASKDPKFIERTMSCQKFFDNFDGVKGDNEW